MKAKRKTLFPLFRPPTPELLKITFLLSSRGSSFVLCGELIFISVQSHSLCLLPFPLTHRLVLCSQRQQQTNDNC